MTKQKVCILGGGIGGLTTAHYLDKEKYEVHVFERNVELGGQARSREVDGKHSEVCWKAIGEGYVHFVNLIADITDEKGETVLSHLLPIQDYIYATNDKTMYENDTSSFLTKPSKFMSGIYQLTGKRYLKDMAKVAWMWVYANSLSDKQLETLDTIYWKDYVSDISPEINRWIVDSTAIYLGMDYSQISVHMMFHLFRQNAPSTLDGTKYNFFSFDKPMNKVWFDVWQVQLEKQGVVFHMNTNIEKIQTDGDNTIKSVTTEKYGMYSEFEADIFINGMDTKGLAKLYPYRPIRERYEQLHSMSQQIQTQVVYYIPYRLKLKNPTILIFPDSEWFLMIRHEGALWGLEGHDVISVGIGIWDVEGKLNNKTATHCTREEIADEVWFQIKKAKTDINFPTCVPKWDIWDSFKYNRKTKSITTYEPKFSNNAYTLQYRPNFDDEYFKNLKHATAYTRTNKNLFCMESAVESGLSVAEIINTGTIVSDTRSNNPGYFFRFMRWINKLFSCC